MRTHVHRAGYARWKVHRSHVIQEDEGAHHAPLGKRQNASNFKAAEILATRLDAQLDHAYLWRVRAGIASSLSGMSRHGYRLMHDGGSSYSRAQKYCHVV